MNRYSDYSCNGKRKIITITIKNYKKSKKTKFCYEFRKYCQNRHEKNENVTDLYITTCYITPKASTHSAE